MFTAFASSCGASMRATCLVRPECTDETMGRSVRIGPHGVIYCFAEGQRTRIECHLSDLTPGLHGLHVHRCGDLSAGCASTCEHYNPERRHHGGPLGPHRHRGDFGNVVADASGKCDTVVVADVALHEIVGRAFVVHADADDLGVGADAESKRTGNAGLRIAGGIIEWD